MLAALRRSLGCWVFWGPVAFLGVVSEPFWGLLAPFGPITVAKFPLSGYIDPVWTLFGPLRVVRFPLFDF